MTKYNINSLGYQMQKAGEEILLLIANEIAESNRLKRIELRMFWSKQSDDWKKYSASTLDHIKEDQVSMSEIQNLREEKQ